LIEGRSSLVFTYQSREVVFKEIFDCSYQSPSEDIITHWSVKVKYLCAENMIIFLR